MKISFTSVYRTDGFIWDWMTLDEAILQTNIFVLLMSHYRFSASLPFPTWPLGPLKRLNIKDYCQFPATARLIFSFLALAWSQHLSDRTLGLSLVDFHFWSSVVMSVPLCKCLSGSLEKSKQLTEAVLEVYMLLDNGRRQRLVIMDWN